MTTDHSHDAAVDAIFMEAVDALLAEVDTLADEILDDLLASFPSFARLTEGTGEFVHAIVRDGTRVFMDAVVSGRSLSTDEIRAIEELAMAPAALGIPTDDMAASCWVGIRHAFAFVVRQAMTLPSRPQSTEALGRLFLAVCAGVEDVTAAVLRGHLAYQRQTVAAEVSALRDMTDALLSGTFESDREIVERGARLGYTLSMPIGVLLVTGPEPASVTVDVLRKARTRLLAAVDGGLDGSMHSTPRLHAVVIAPISSERHWATLVERVRVIAAELELVVVAAGPGRHPSDVHTNYRDAASLLPLAAQVAEAGLVVPEDLLVYRLVAGGRDEAIALARNVLSPVLNLPERRRDALFETLTALWEADGRVGRAAELLCLTDKALRYRMGILKELTGLDPLRPADRLRLDLARHAVAVHSAAFGLEPDTTPAQRAGRVFAPPLARIGLP